MAVDFTSKQLVPLLRDSTVIFHKGQVAIAIYIYIYIATKSQPTQTVFLHSSANSKHASYNYTKHV